MSMTRWFEFLRWAMLTAVMAWTASGTAQEARNRAEPSSPGSLDSSSDSRAAFFGITECLTE